MATQYDFTAHKVFRKGETIEQHQATHKAVAGEHKCPLCHTRAADDQFGAGNWRHYTTRSGALGMIQPAQTCGLFKLGDMCSDCREKPSTVRVGLILGSGRAWAFNWTCDDCAEHSLDRMG